MKEEYKFCPYCQVKNRLIAIYCIHCGKKLLFTFISKKHNKILNLTTIYICFIIMIQFFLLIISHHM